MAYWSAKHRKPQAGLSLLGTLLAAFLLASVSIAASRLVVRTQQASGMSREFLTATALGREGLELVRALRDTNWFLGASDNRHWTQGLCSTTDNAEQFTETREFTIDAASVRNLDSVGDFEQPLLYIEDNGEWAHAPSSHPTVYRRVLSVDCREKDISLLITAKISWPGRGGQDREWTVSERLYDWLP